MTQRRATHTFPVGVIVSHYTSDERYRVANSNPYRTLVVTIDDVEIFFSTVDLTITN